MLTLALVSVSAESASNDVARSFHARKFAAVDELIVAGVGASHTRTMRSGIGEGEWLQQHRIDQAEHRRIGADAERQHADGDEGEDRIARERREAVADVLDRVLEPADPAAVAMRVLHLGDAAESLPGSVACVLRREPRGDGVAFGKLEVRQDLVVQLLFEPAVPDQREQPLHEAPRAHDLASRKRATSALACSQVATSTCSCRAPAFVRE